ncbi:copper amine oxidase [Paenibacillus sp. UASWS1643]|uniref:copper amine oxidase n=1 Tax=Paenibacillus sp. UASWS1643 TaxID=2580422 RepID=UPI001238C590|nr:copper amine oxidase [Paenibacillus sp. UASWS1643]KAA8756526.1 copper amine oxidase [Paenibacillus sp. UASWS1643]
MKKVAYIAGGIVIGIVFSTTSSVLADGVKSLVGKKVTGEYTVVVNGKTLSDKGAIIDGKANVPVREYSKALGADIKVEGKTINVTTINAQSEETAVVDNKYAGRSKADLEESLSIFRDKILAPNLEGKATIEEEIAYYKTSGMKPEEYTARTKALSEYSERIEKANTEITEIEAALAALK